MVIWAGKQVHKSVAAGFVRLSLALVDPGVAVVVNKRCDVYLDLGGQVDRVEPVDTNPRSYPRVTLRVTRDRLERKRGLVWRGGNDALHCIVLVIKHTPKWAINNWPQSRDMV